MSISLYEYCIERGKQKLLDQWHPTKNGDVKPEHLSYGSERVVWWRCEKGHEWETRVFFRTSSPKPGCPYCSNRKIIAGENDLATIFPEIAKEWHPTKNGELRPDAVAPKALKLVWWQCEKGHDYQCQVSWRTDKGTGCPYCSNRLALAGFNDLGTTHPEIAAQWHPTKNGELTPEMVKWNTDKKAWWICEKGHDWEAAIKNRVRGTGCPYCYGNRIWVGFNDLATLQPTLAAQWHPTKNGDLTPQMVGIGTHKRAWWICDKGHEWEALVFIRAGKWQSGCPICSGRKRK